MTIIHPYPFYIYQTEIQTKTIAIYAFLFSVYVIILCAKSETNMWKINRLCYGVRHHRLLLTIASVWQEIVPSIVCDQTKEYYKYSIHTS